MAAKLALLSFVFLLSSASGLTFAGFVFSPADEAALSGAAADAQAKGRALAEKLREELPSSSEAFKQLEPAVDPPRENEKEKETRGELLAAASLFNVASSENTEEQQAAEDALREAMASPSRIGQPDRSTHNEAPSACLPDFSKCPKGWNEGGALCIASGGYAGPCAAEQDLRGKSIEQKLAFANACSASFPCQEECTQDFQQACPSLWREIGNGLCSAPLQYEGQCAARVEIGSMSEKDKYAWSIRCGARWPCTSASKRSYDDVCPSGWSLQLGKVCTAPPIYNGPCEHKAYLSDASLADKKAFEATCGVEWAAGSAAGACIHDYGALCPFGWYQHGLECLAPLTYSTCSKRKSFVGMTPAAREDWAHNCKVTWPCQSRHQCNKAYSAPCPAGWFAFNGGASCRAPSSYAGSCAAVLHGLTDLSADEKMAIETKCGVDFPCAGEVYASVLQ